jgi:hypothetical protein
MGTDRKEISFTEKRREICNKCEHLTTIIGAKICNSCGCSVWAKTMIPIAKCPEGKWNAE